MRVIWTVWWSRTSIQYTSLREGIFIERVFGKAIAHRDGQKYRNSNYKNIENLSSMENY